MRNCFVPNCDSYSKHSMPKRKMFQPPKDPEIFMKWKQVLPKKREFKLTDKVCERHFPPDCIVTTWDHMIEGKLHQVERNKPKLKPNAIPSLNIPLDGEFKKTKRKLSEEAEGGTNKKLFESPEMPIEHQVIVPENIEPVPQVVDWENVQIIPHIADSSFDKVKEQFDTFYDEIYEVILPSTLWGIHRDPELKRFVAFSEFSMSSMSTSKILYIDSKLNYRQTINNIIHKEDVFTELSVEKITEVLNEFDEF